MSDHVTTPAENTANPAQYANDPAWAAREAMREADDACFSAWKTYVARHYDPMHASCIPHGGSAAEVETFAAYKAALDRAVAAELFYLKREWRNEALAEVVK